MDRARTAAATAARPETRSNTRTRTSIRAWTRIRTRRTTTWLGVAATLALAIVGTAAPDASAATYRYDCRRLAGAGSYSSPFQLGNVTGRTVVAVNCPPLTSGVPYNHRYFAFTLTRAARVPSLVGATFQLNSAQSSAVNPSLSRGPVTWLHTSAGIWTRDRSTGALNGRYLPLAPYPGGGVLPAGTYRVDMQKLRSPLSSLSTPWFNVVVAVS
ncbi:hypothetical protein [Streptomyces mangrovisoli]|uniref:Uncharacterized protein n=1 Tax=Streptomyces mangrovisoli TaxID=1428628 RepID=A0A1J4NN67_9ACTN|nr:hypothetical protein [Streptomyces mangrovisoli]OIJ63578.1 hypothetical protein WN71_032640 [Streptomyces mangrovisoli]